VLAGIAPPSPALQPLPPPRLHGRRFVEEYVGTYTVLPVVKGGDGWVRSVQEANFTFSPRGFGETSFRLSESILLGSIPVYVWEHQKFLPFQELVDWSEFAVVMEMNEMVDGGLKREIDRLQDRVPDMLKRLREVKHMFTYNYTSWYIVDRVKGIHDVPSRQEHCASAAVPPHRRPAP
jgi:hypothetical protein